MPEIRKSKNYDDPVWVEARDRMSVPRTHVAERTDRRGCPEHGDFDATLWRLDPMPKVSARATSGVLAPFLEPFWTQCPACEEKMAREAAESDARIRSGVTQKEAAHRMRQDSMRIPSRFRQATVWNWTHAMPQQRKVWDWARDYVSGFEVALETGRSAMFVGQTGTGKTHLAVGLLNHVGEKGGTGHYTTAAELAARFRATYGNSDGETEAGVMQELAAVDLLVIDEVGKNLGTDHDHSQLFRLIDQRYGERRPVILVSNLPRAELTRFLGEPVLDRLREAGGAMLPFDWGSHRSRKRVDLRKRDEDEGR